MSGGEFEFFRVQSVFHPWLKILPGRGPSIKRLRNPSAAGCASGAVRCGVNGVLKQDSNTAQLMLDVAGAIAVLSHGRTLEPGDIIATGTPEGVGFARKPPEFLAAGDVVECEVESIGRLCNAVVAVGA